MTVLGNTNKDYFRGILLVAQRIDNKEIVGLWKKTSEDYKILECRERSSAITHQGLFSKSNPSFHFYLPSLNIGDIEFR